MRISQIAAAALILLAPAAQAQDLPTDQLDGHADVVRQKMLRDATVGRNRDKVGPRRHPTSLWIGVQKGPR